MPPDSLWIKPYEIRGTWFFPNINESLNFKGLEKLPSVRPSLFMYEKLRVMMVKLVVTEGRASSDSSHPRGHTFYTIPSSLSIRLCVQVALKDISLLIRILGKGMVFHFQFFIPFYFLIWTTRNSESLLWHNKKYQVEKYN